jgi:uncharacterized protein YeaO (DUF488 family)
VAARSQKADAIDQWVKDIAPSTASRKWFGHDPDRWAEFRRRYAAEVHLHPEQLSALRVLARQGPITLVFSARDELHNDAVALRDAVGTAGETNAEGGFASSLMRSRA